MDSHPEAMGYFRPVSNMNIGKKAEFYSRKQFNELVSISNNEFNNKYK